MPNIQILNGIETRELDMEKFKKIKDAIIIIFYFSKTVVLFLRGC